VLDTLLESTIRFVSNKTPWPLPWKPGEDGNIAMLLKGAIEARAKVGLKLNAPEAKLADIISFLPAENRPPCRDLADTVGWRSRSSLRKNRKRELIPRLKRAGATGIIGIR